MSSTLLELAARCEAAAGPDRELDVLIWADQLGVEAEWQGTYLVVGEEGVVGWIDPGKHQRNFSTNRNSIGPSSIPAYTSSLDAAMSLLTEGSEISLTNLYGVARAHVDMNDEHGGHHGEHLCGSLPLALVAACLRARAETEGK